jgi:cobalt-precorrin 5A hydrolase / precorrin-3B C17-methyltransferase
MLCSCPPSSSKLTLPLQDFQPIAAIATTPQGIKTLQSFCQSGEVDLWGPETCRTDGLPAIEAVNFYPEALSTHLKSLWSTHQGLIFCLSMGVVVRLIAPLLQHKSSDPAVIVVDPSGHFVISVCSGHQGGADQLARVVAAQLGATPILTGAANHLGLSGIDCLGTPWGWQKGAGDWTGVSSAIAHQKPIEVFQEVGSTLWQSHLPPSHPFLLDANPDLRSTPERPAARVWISFTHRQFAPESNIPKVQWHPRVLWIGIGCERGTSVQLIQSAIQTYDWPLVCFSAEILRTIRVPNPSSIVANEVGTPSVAEAAAIVAARHYSAISDSSDSSDQTELSSLADPPLLVSKQIVHSPDQPGAVTVAIAVAEREYTGRLGQLWLVGTGPGALDQMTPAAKGAIVQADVVIGYSLYLDLVRPLFRPGQILESTPITQERQRAERAIALAEQGLTVAVISSGDCGIYGMAGLVLELLQTQGWDGKTPAIQVFPGVTALQSAASRVGAPLMHDFCAISLSDLLTPWEVIEKRLQAAAQADFVIALYNPRSQRRTEQLAIAQQILLTYRNPQTPVAIVQSAYRPDEQVHLTTLDQLLTVSIDMLSTVLIGNSSTRLHHQWMITPRGYLGEQ